MRSSYHLLPPAGLAAMLAFALAASADDTPTPAADDASRHTLAGLRGRVAYLAEVLRQREGIETVPEAEQRMLAVVAADGELTPLVEDVRGRAFRVDQRLRDRELVLLVRQYPTHPLAQVIRVFEPQDDGLYELDYWCDICAIAMVELKACDCCQGPIRLRSRKLDTSNLPPPLRP